MFNRFPPNDVVGFSWNSLALDRQEPEPPLGDSTTISSLEVKNGRRARRLVLPPENPHTKSANSNMELIKMIAIRPVFAMMLVSPNSTVVGKKGEDSLQLESLAVRDAFFVSPVSRIRGSGRRTDAPTHDTQTRHDTVHFHWHRFQRVIDTMSRIRHHLSSCLSVSPSLVQ